MDNYLNSLNEKQLEAVRLVDGPIEVIAGAGTGKTKTLTSRIIYLIKENYAKVSQILAVTFTNKAADEMKKRVTKELDNLPPSFLNIMTFHSFGLKVLRRFGDHLRIGKIDSHIITIDEEDQKKIINDVKKGLDIKNAKMHDIISYISYRKNAECLGRSSYKVHPEIDRIFDSYQKLLIENNLGDFDDLLIYTYQLLQDESILEIYHREIKYLLIDEFQDTSELQYLIVKLLAIQHRNIFIVGDPDQAIYAFRGASYENEKLFNLYFKPTLIVLDKNYRSTNIILAHANALIKENSGRVDKNLVSDDNRIINVYRKSFRNERAEASSIADDVEYLISTGVPHSEIAILYRSNFLSRVYEEEFLKRRIDYKIYSGHSFFEREEVKDLVAYLRLITDTSVDFALKRIVNKPLRGIGIKTIDRLAEYAHDINQSMFNAISTYGNERLVSFVEDIEYFQSRLQSCVKLVNFFDEVIEKIKFKEYLKEYKDSPEERIQNILELKSIIAYNETIYEMDNLEKLANILDIFSLESSIEETKSKKKEQCIVLSTYHRVKGLEFNSVFLVAMESGIFPSPQARETHEIEEERRIAYVGVTRAKERLFISSCTNRYVFGTSLISQESIFVKEMFKNVVELGLLKPKRQVTKNEEDLYVGKKKHHKIYGIGIVVKFDEKTVSLAFPLPYGIKNFKRKEKED